MSKKDVEKNRNIKPRVNPQSLKEALITIRSRFKAGEIKKIEDISNFYVTGLVAALGIGYDGLITKLNSPEKFTLEDLFRLSDITETDFDLIWDIVKKEAQRNHKKRDISHLLPKSE